MNMDRARVNTLKSTGCSNSFGSFESTYPTNLQGAMERIEFENTIENLNKKCNSVLSKKYYLLFLISLVGIILAIVGISKSVGNMDAPKQNNFNFSENDGPSPSNAAGGFVLIVIGFVLMFLGCCIFGIAFAVFKNKVLNKIKNELAIVNQHFISRRISWSLKSEVVRKYIPSHEYNLHKNNDAYRRGIKYDYQQNPYREETVHFIEVEFPATQNYVPVHFSNPQVQMNGTTSNNNSGFGFSSNGGNISIEMSSNF
ncbi:hypothetical protein ACTFIZ_007879 [Dictyostelium cf. discoideum]